MQEAIDGNYYDDLIPVPGPAGIEWSSKLARKEGIFTGISGGSTFAVAMQVAEKAEPGSVILAMLPDTGERLRSMSGTPVPTGPSPLAINCARP